MDSASQPTLSEKSAKSIFASKTFWGAALTAVAAIAPKNIKCKGNPPAIALISLTAILLTQVYKSIEIESS